jgi:hypothetical protein
VFVAILYFLVSRFVRFIKFKILRWNLLNFMKFIKKHWKLKKIVNITSLIYM